MIASISPRQLKGCRTLPGPRAPIPDTTGEVACFVCLVKSGAASGRVCPLLCPSTPPASLFSASPATRGTLRFCQQEGHVLGDVDHNRRHKPAGACAPALIVWIVLWRCVRDGGGRLLKVVSDAGSLTQRPPSSLAPSRANSRASRMSSWSRVWTISRHIPRWTTRGALT